MQSRPSATTFVAILHFSVACVCSLSLPQTHTNRCRCKNIQTTSQEFRKIVSAFDLNAAISPISTIHSNHEKFNFVDLCRDCQRRQSATAAADVSFCAKMYALGRARSLQPKCNLSFLIGSTVRCVRVKQQHNVKCQIENREQKKRMKTRKMRCNSTQDQHR